MQAWVKGVLVTLAATATILVVSGTTASAATTATASAPQFAGTTTAEVAQRVYARLASAPARKRTSLARIHRLPERLTAPIVGRTLRDRNRDGRDDDGLVAFSVGQRNRACLNLRTGQVAPGTCRRVAASLRPLNLRTAAGLLHRTVVWYDRHAKTYGMHPQDVALVRAAAARELPATMSIVLADADADRRVDGGQVVLADSASGHCLAVALPDHDPRGASYTSASWYTDCP